MPIRLWRVTFTSKVGGETIGPTSHKYAMTEDELDDIIADIEKAGLTNDASFSTSHATIGDGQHNLTVDEMKKLLKI